MTTRYEPCWRSMAGSSMRFRTAASKRKPPAKKTSDSSRSWRARKARSRPSRDSGSGAVTGGVSMTGPLVATAIIPHGDLALARSVRYNPRWPEALPPMQLRIQNLSKRYPNGVQALAEVSLDIPAGMFGLLGPNGAGKSTLMRTLATLQEADSGTAAFTGGDAGAIDMLANKDRVRELLGSLPQESGVYPKVTAIELLD